MTHNISNSKGNNGLPLLADEQAIETLRLVATLPPPEGLTDRVHQRIAVARSVSSTTPSRASAVLQIWRLWMPMQRLQFAGAALLVVAIGASSWGAYEGRLRPGQQTQPASQPSSPQTSSQPSSPPTPASTESGFRTAGSERRPSTLTPIKVPPAGTRKKPSATHLAKPGASPRTTAQKAPSDDAPVQPQR